MIVSERGVVEISGKINVLAADFAVILQGIEDWTNEDSTKTTYEEFMESVELSRKVTKLMDAGMPIDQAIEIIDPDIPKDVIDNAAEEYDKYIKELNK